MHWCSLPEWNIPIITFLEINLDFSRVSGNLDVTILKGKLFAAKPPRVARFLFSLCAFTDFIVFSVAKFSLNSGSTITNEGVWQCLLGAALDTVHVLVQTLWGYYYYKHVQKKCVKNVQDSILISYLGKRYWNLDFFHLPKWQVIPRAFSTAWK